MTTTLSEFKCKVNEDLYNRILEIAEDSGIIEHYKTDLTTHDRNYLADLTEPARPLVLLLREYGTHLFETPDNLSFYHDRCCPSEFDIPGAILLCSPESSISVWSGETYERALEFLIDADSPDTVPAAEEVTVRLVIPRFDAWIASLPWSVRNNETTRQKLQDTYTLHVMQAIPTYPTRQQGMGWRVTLCPFRAIGSQYESMRYVSMEDTDGHTKPCGGVMGIIVTPRADGTVASVSCHT